MRNYRLAAVSSLFIFFITPTHAQSDTQLRLEAASSVSHFIEDFSFSCFTRISQSDYKEIIQEELPFYGSSASNANFRDGSASSYTELSLSEAAGLVRLSNAPSYQAYDECPRFGSGDAGSSGKSGLRDKLYFTNTTGEVQKLDYVITAGITSGAYSSDSSITGRASFTFTGGALQFEYGSDLVANINTNNTNDIAMGTAIIPRNESLAGIYFDFSLGAQATTETGPVSDLEAAFRLELGPLPDGVSCQSESGRFPGCDFIVPPPAEMKVVVFYINGIQNERIDAAIDYYVLRSKLTQAFGGSLPSDITVLFFHNPTAGKSLSGLFFDLVEVLEQQLDLLGLGVDLDQVPNKLDATLTSAVGAILRNLSSTPEAIQTAIQEEIAEIANAPTASTVLADFINDLRTNALDKGDKAVIVAHSQGNLYANLAYNALQPNEQARTRIVSIASPAQVSAGNGLHTTDLNDVIIRLVPTALNANTSNAKGNIFNLFYTNWYGHSLRSYYLAPGFESEAKIISDIQTQINSLR